MRPGLALALLISTMAAPANAQSGDGQPFRIFFDWSKPELTRDAQATLAEVAAAYNAQPSSRVELTGHADRSGPANVNLAASRHRAEAVKAWLVQRGIPTSNITVAAHGESRPIVPTEDGVREAQNRRVEVRIIRRE